MPRPIKYHNPNPDADTRDAHDYSYKDALANLDGVAYRNTRGYVYIDALPDSDAPIVINSPRYLNPHATTAGDAAAAAAPTAGYREWGLQVVGWTLALGALALASWGLYLWLVSRA